MRSTFQKKFNHDGVADVYDDEVKHEENPVRAGYERVMAWVSEKTTDAKVVLDLGCGTGNTAQRVLHFERMVCVDVSEQMLLKAQEKFARDDRVTFIQEDALGFFESVGRKKFDTVISTYALHHLTAVEKIEVLGKISQVLTSSGTLILGDLMYKNKAYEHQMKAKYPKLVADFDDEFYWYVDDAVKELSRLGFTVEVKQFSDLSWGLQGKKSKKKGI